MGEITTGLAIACIVALLIGGGLGYVIHPDTKIVETIKEVSGPEKIVEKEVPIEVEKIVEKEVSVDYVGKAIAELLKKVKKTDSLKECGDDEYDFEQITVAKAYQEYSFELEDEEDNEYEVEAKAKLKYKQEDEKQCYRTFNFKVQYEEDEKPIVTIL